MTHSHTHQNTDTHNTREQYGKKWTQIIERRVCLLGGVYILYTHSGSVHSLYNLHYMGWVMLVCLMGQLLLSLSLSVAILIPQFGFV